MKLLGYIELTLNWCNVIFSTSVSTLKPEMSYFFINRKFKISERIYTPKVSSKSVRRCSSNESVTHKKRHLNNNCTKSRVTRKRNRLRFIVWVSNVTWNTCQHYPHRAQDALTIFLWKQKLMFCSVLCSVRKFFLVFCSVLCSAEQNRTEQICRTCSVFFHPWLV